MKFIDLTGNVFDRLTVISKSENKTKSNHILWNCLCQCGKTIEAKGNNLNSGNTRSCGCLISENVSKANSKHSDCNSSEYNIWRTMKARCNNENQQHYKDYGGRGIRVCDRWLNYNNFINDIGRRPSNKHSIDRINNNGNYEPGNCKWSTSKEQNNNKRNTKLN